MMKSSSKVSQLIKDDIQSKIIQIYKSVDPEINTFYYTRKINELIKDFNKNVKLGKKEDICSEKTILLISYADNLKIKGEKNIPDHYNLKTKSVVVEKDRLNKKSLTSITVICHEIGHAIQHKENYEPLVNEQKVKKATKWISNVGSMIFFIGIPSIIASGSLPLIRICLIIAFLTVIINMLIQIGQAMPHIPYTCRIQDTKQHILVKFIWLINVGKIILDLDLIIGLVL